MISDIYEAKLSLIYKLRNRVLSEARIKSSKVLMYETLSILTDRSKVNIHCFN